MFYTKKQKVNDLHRLFYVTLDFAKAKCELGESDCETLGAIVNTMIKEIIHD